MMLICNQCHFFNNSEATASELLENFEEVIPRYYMHSDLFCMLKYSTTQ